MSCIQLKKVTPTDLPELQTIGRQTFNETFAPVNSEENMRRYLEEGFSIGKLTKELNDSNAEFYFALDDDRVIGYLKVNFGQSQTELKDDNAMEIERIYVLKEYHGQSVGQLLYNKALELAQLKNAHYVWLGVWEKNERALRFYEKNGFIEFSKHVFKLGDDEQTDVMMRKQL